MKKFIDLNYNCSFHSNETKLNYSIYQFNCGEYDFLINEDINNIDIDIYQKFSVGNFNDEIIKFQIICGILKRNNVSNINYIAPFLPYTRQNIDKSKIIVEIINNCNIKKLITYDIHDEKIKESLQCDLLNQSAIPFFIKDIQKKFNFNDTIIVFPDFGSHNRFKKFFQNINFEIVTMNKIRSKYSLTMEISDFLCKKNAIIIDDIIDSGKTIIEASKLLKQHSAKQIFVYATHGILSGDAVKLLTEQNEIKKITITNSIIQKKILSKKFDIIKL